jgi:oligopeptide/dipeptide ABC transporter ATP-binding protein
MALLEVDNLSVSFFTHQGVMPALNGVSLDLEQGEMLGLVGETGSGKSVLARSMLGLVRSPGRVTSGTVRFDGRDLFALRERKLDEIRGKDIALIVTNPRAQLNPLLPVGEQIANVYRSHFRVSRAEAHAEAVRMLKSVGIPDPERRAASYPHQLSGGMAQRILIAMALICDPRVLVADDATNGLDVTVQRQVLMLMRDLIGQRNSAAIFVTHDLGVVAQYCQKVAILQAGQIVEYASTHNFFARPRHPYSLSLLTSLKATSNSYERITLSRVPRLARQPSQGGCGLSADCPLAVERCRKEEPLLSPAVAGHLVRCHVRGAA